MNNKKTLPFEESSLNTNKTQRVFSKDLDQEDLEWHFDEEDRIIKPVGDTDWLFQFDNSLPQMIEGEIFIEKGVWHRLIKGSNDLILEVTKLQ